MKQRSSLPSDRIFQNIFLLCPILKIFFCLIYSKKLRKFKINNIAHNVGLDDRLQINSLEWSSIFNVHSNYQNTCIDNFCRPDVLKFIKNYLSPLSVICSLLSFEKSRAKLPSAPGVFSMFDDYNYNPNPTQWQYLTWKMKIIIIMIIMKIVTYKCSYFLQIQ